MRAMFQGRPGWWEHLEGNLTTPPPVDKTVEYAAWQQIDVFVRSAIVLALSATMQEYTEPPSMTAKQTWNKVCEPHLPKGMSSFAQLFRQLWVGCAYESGTPMQSHIEKFSSIANRLAEMGEAVPDKYLACALLFSVPSDWEIRQSITLNTLPANGTALFRHVANDYLQEEKTRVLNRGVSATAPSSQQEAFGAQVQAYLTQTGVKVCTFPQCTRRMGHLEADCFAKHPDKKKEFDKRQGRNVSRKNKGSGKGKALNANSAGSDSEEEDEKGVSRRNAYSAVVMDASALSGGSTNFNSDSWVVDSGASVHLCNSEHWFTELLPCKPERITVANNEVLVATRSGTVEFRVLAGDKFARVSFSGVLFVPGVKVNLLSVSRMDKAGLSVSIGGGLCIVRNPYREVIGSAARCAQSNLYQLTVKPMKSRAIPSPALSAITDDASQLVVFANTQSSRPVSWAVLHARLGHLHSAGMKQLLSDHMADGVVVSSDDAQPDLSMCRGCIQGKSHRAPFPLSEHRATERLALVHSDVAGPFSKRSFTGQRFFVTFIDDCTRLTSVFLIKEKSEVFACFKEWRGFAERETGQRIGILRCDGGGEYGIADTYQTGEFNVFRREHSIQLHHTAAGSPQQNGVAERANRTIMESTRSMLTAAGLPKQYWGFAVRCAVYLRNRCPSKLLNKVTPFEAYFGLKPDLSILRVFGCKTLALVTKDHDKLEAKTVPLIMVGYSETVKGGLCLFNPDTKRMVHRRVGEVWCEEPTTGSLVIPTDTAAPQAVERRSRSDSFDEDAWDDSTKADVGRPAPLPAAVVVPPVPSSGRIGTRSNPSPPVSVNGPLPSMLRSLTDHLAPAGTGKDIPAVVQHAHSLASSEAVEPDDEHHCFSVMMSELNESFAEPATWQEALAGPDSEAWWESMTEEIDSTTEAKTWDLVELPEGRTAIGCKWVQGRKRDAEGKVVRFKSRIVVKGYSQKEGVDYTETFAPVARMSDLRALLAVVAADDLELHQMDVKTAFLNGDLTEEIYMKQPPGFVVPGKERLVCRLNKALYGLKQAGRSWYKKMDSTLSKLGFTALPTDNCIYVQRSDADAVFLLLYVDDLLIACRLLERVTSIKAKLAGIFSMKDMGEAQFILGLQIVRDRPNRMLSLSQSQYIDTVLRRFNMHQSVPQPTPCDTGMDLRKSTVEATAEEAREMADKPYSSAVGAIMYAMLGTRPDIAYAVSVLSQFMHAPRLPHWKAVKRLLRYLQFTKDHKLHYGVHTPHHFHGYTDSNWAGDKGDRRSTCGYVFFLHGGAINWRSRKQKSVALSSVEAEYVAACEAGRDAVHWRSFLSDLGSPLLVPGPITIHCDSQGAIALSKNPEHHDRSKHIDIAYHWIRQQQAEGVIGLEYMNTQLMVADVLTKPLVRDRHAQLTYKLGLWP